MIKARADSIPVSQWVALVRE
uniref:Uncharacterized protein n=1 Tax=Anguilla anguilla TaxID=7936 RepID=A0A0E9QB80_ANGAN